MRSILARRPVQRRRFAGGPRRAPCLRPVSGRTPADRGILAWPSKTPSAGYAEIAFDYGAPGLIVIRTNLKGNCLSASLCP